MDRRSFGTAKAVPFHDLEISMVVAPDWRMNWIVFITRRLRAGLSNGAPAELE
jgi:hypothetical protein